MADTAKDKKDNEVSVKLYNPNAGIYGRDGGPYLDEIEAANFEKINAAREGAKPDLVHPRPYPGIQLVPGPVLVAGYNPTLNGGDDRRAGIDLTEGITVTHMAEAQFPNKPFNTITETNDPETGDEIDFENDPNFTSPILDDVPEDNKVTPADVDSPVTTPAKK